MNKYLIVYSSKTGNTKQIAESMYSAIADLGDLKSIDDEIEWEIYDVIFLGYSVEYGMPNKKAREFLAKLQGKSIVLFQTLGVEAMGEHAMISLANAVRYLGSNCKIVGAFSSQGKIDPNLLDRLAKLPANHPHAPSIESQKRWQKAAVHPDATDLLEAHEFALKIKKRMNFLAQK